jgi:hypothetical protein
MVSSPEAAPKPPPVNSARLTSYSLHSPVHSRRMILGQRFPAKACVLPADTPGISGHSRIAVAKAPSAVQSPWSCLDWRCPIHRLRQTAYPESDCAACGSHRRIYPGPVEACCCPAWKEHQNTLPWKAMIMKVVLIRFIEVLLRLLQHRGYIK